MTLIYITCINLNLNMVINVIILLVSKNVTERFQSRYVKRKKLIIYFVQ